MTEAEQQSGKGQTQASPSFSLPKRPAGQHYSRKGTGSGRIKETLIINSQRQEDNNEKISDSNFTRKVFEALRATPTIRLNQTKTDTNTNNAGGDNDEFCEDEDNAASMNKKHCVKNVHELLQCGGTNRLLEELEYLVAGLESLKSKKSSLDKRPKNAKCHQVISEISRKLLSHNSSTLLSALRSSGLIQRIFASFEDEFVEDTTTVRYLFELLYHCCSQVRRIDNFASLSLCSNLVKASLVVNDNDKENGITDNNNDDDDDDEKSLEKKPIHELGIWLYAKLVFMDQKDSLVDGTWQDIFQMTCKFFLNAPTVIACQILFIMEYYIKNEHDISFIYNLLLEYLLASVDITIGSIKSIESSLCALNLLLLISGPDSGALIISENKTLLAKACQLFKLFLTSLVDEGNEEIRVLSASQMINCIDRSAAARKFLCTFDSFGVQLESAVLANCQNATGKSARTYEGVLLGILYHDQPSLISKATSLIILHCFDQLMASLAQDQLLSESLKSQLLFLSSPYRS